MLKLYIISFDSLYKYLKGLLAGLKIKNYKHSIIHHHLSFFIIEECS